MDEILTVFENNHVDPPWSHALVLSLDAIAILAVVWCIRQVREARRAARQAKRLEQSSLPLHEGSRFVAGHVELAEGAKTAIRVTITQEGAEHEVKNGHRHTWTEVHREVEAVPFYVRAANGERVRVEPPVDVMLVDKLDQMEWTSAASRRRRAELTPGERAIIEGRLERGPDPETKGAGGSYRAAVSMGWIMKPTKRKGMYVSAESLSLRHELRAKAFVWTTIFVSLLGIVATSSVVPYRARLIRGKTVVADYIGKGTYETRDSKGRTRIHRTAIVNYSDDEQHNQIRRFEVDSDDYDALPLGRGKIWLRQVGAHPWATALGKNSSVASWQIALAATALGLGIYWIIRTHRHRRWYEGPLIEDGDGTLPPPPNARFAEDTLPAQPQARRPVVPKEEFIIPDFGTDEPRRD
ncbi:MAG: hypothetical protein IPM54_38570 [Polyangiaceae bacterium]|nr:hypothetical protein [Polyangiaceae bacterium]